MKLVLSLMPLASHTEHKDDVIMHSGNHWDAQIYIDRYSTGFTARLSNHIVKFCIFIY